MIVPEVPLGSEISGFRLEQFARGRLSSSRTWRKFLKLVSANVMRLTLPAPL